MLLHEKIDGITIVELPVKLNSTNDRAFTHEFAQLVEPNAKIVLDLTKVHHLDSSGLGAMVGCLKQVQTAGGKLMLFGLSKQVRTLFELVRMHHLFDIYNTRQEAIESLK